MLVLGTHPRIAAMLLAPRDATEQALACDLAALLEARDPLRTRSDAVADRWQALAAFRAGRVTAEASHGALAAIDASARQWRRRLGVAGSPPATAGAHRLGDLLVHAFPDRVAHRHPRAPLRYQLANGRMAVLYEDSALQGESWLVASELRHESGDARILRAAPVDEARLRRDFPERFGERERVHWDPQRRALVAMHERHFDEIVLEARPAGRVDPALAAPALLQAVRELGLEALPWSESLVQWRVRVQSLRHWMPEFAASLPDLSDAALLDAADDWLLPLLSGLSGLDGITPDALARALRERVDWDLRQRIDRLVPERITVPSGMARRIDYALEADGTPRSPVLAVKLQELFGLPETPRIADGRVPLLLHLLSPAGRPLQVTADLRSFWDTTWPEVRREMKGRYPKHPWPEDPWSATATHRARPRG